MLKLIVLLFGLAVGFGGGVYWAHKNPEAAAKVSAEEERRFLEAQLALTQKLKAKIDQLGGGGGPAPKTPGSGFVSAGQGGSGAGANQAEVNALKSDAQRQEDDLRKRLEALK